MIGRNEIAAALYFIALAGVIATASYVWWWKRKPAGQRLTRGAAGLPGRTLFLIEAAMFVTGLLLTAGSILEAAFWASWLFFLLWKIMKGIRRPRQASSVAP